MIQSLNRAYAATYTKSGKLVYSGNPGFPREQWAGRYDASLVSVSAVRKVDGSGFDQRRRKLRVRSEVGPRRSILRLDSGWPDPVQLPDPRKRFHVAVTNGFAAEFPEPDLIPLATFVGHDAA